MISSRCVLLCVKCCCSSSASAAEGRVDGLANRRMKIQQARGNSFCTCTFQLWDSLFWFSVSAFHFLQVFQEFTFLWPALLEQRLQLSQTHRQLDYVTRSLRHIFVLMGKKALHLQTNQKKNHNSSLYLILQQIWKRWYYCTLRLSMELSSSSLTCSEPTL